MKLSICVPYRNREAHLRKFIPYMKEYLKGYDYEILVVEQTQEKPFNRGALANIGFLLTNSHTFCIHDVDMLPELANYEIPHLFDVSHVATNIEQFGYKMPYKDYIGGVTVFKREAFRKINGFNNLYFGWGAEDDDLNNRCELNSLKIFRTTNTFASLPHEKSLQSRESKLLHKKNLDTLKHWRQHTSNGLSNVKYKIVKGVTLKDYPKITVQIL